MVGFAQVPGQGQLADAGLFFHFTHGSVFNFFVRLHFAFGKVPFSIAFNPEVGTFSVANHTAGGEDFAVAIAETHPQRFGVGGQEHDAIQIRVLTDEIRQRVKGGFVRFADDKRMRIGGGIFLKKHRPVHDVNFIHSCHGFVR